MCKTLSEVIEAIDNLPFKCPGPSRQSFAGGYPGKGTEMSVSKCMDYANCGCSVYDAYSSLYTDSFDLQCLEDVEVLDERL